MKTPRFRYGLLAEILSMAVGTLVTNKLRSALTILGMVIGVTSIVGMTSLIRGFGDQMESLIRQMGSDNVYVSKMSIASFAAGKEFWDLMRRPDLTATFMIWSSLIVLLFGVVHLIGTWKAWPSLAQGLTE